jgi:hypothetical protein
MLQPKLCYEPRLGTVHVPRAERQATRDPWNERTGRPERARSERSGRSLRMTSPI